MMHACPKCGFTQPKDQYCANCGVDIDNFKPDRPSLFVRLAKNTTAQITAAVLAILLMGVLIFVTQKAQIEKVQNAFVVTSDPGLNTPSTDLEVDENLAETAPTLAPIGTPRAAAPTEITPIQNNKLAMPRQMKISFAELSRPTAMRILSENQLLSESAQTRILLVENKKAEEKYNDASDFLSLPGTETQNIVARQAVEINFTSLSPSGGEEVGMNLTFMPTRLQGDTVDMELNAIIMLKNEAGASMTTTEVDLSFSFAPQNSIVILGVIPHQNTFEPDLSLFSNSPLSILSSSQFQSATSEFAMFITLE